MEMHENNVKSVKKEKDLHKTQPNTQGSNI